MTAMDAQSGTIERQQIIFILWWDDRSPRGLGASIPRDVRVVRYPHGSIRVDVRILEQAEKELRPKVASDGFVD